MAKFDVEMEWDKKGNIVSRAIYPETKITISTSKGDIEAGTQPSYYVTNIIEKDKIEDLLEFLESNFSALEQRRKKLLDVIKNLEHIDGSFMDRLKLLPIQDLTSGKKKYKKLEHLNKLIQDAYMKHESEANLKLIEEDYLKFKKQIDFIKKR